MLSQTSHFLAMTIMTASLPQERVKTIRLCVAQFRSGQKVTYLLCQTLLGMMASAVEHAAFSNVVSVSKA